jgi:hypothetical protein
LKEIYYVYPKWKNISFSQISKQHIARLSKRCKIQEIDESILDHQMWLHPRDIILHPILYSVMGDRADMLEVRQRRFAKLLKVKGKLGGFETADSDRISDIAVDVCNHFDSIFLPTNYAVETYKRSGVTVPLEVVPHGLDDVMLSPTKKIDDPNMLQLQNMKKEKGAFFVLFFCLHSEYRKGADIVAEAMEFVQSRNSDVYMIYKGNGAGAIFDRLSRMKMKHIQGWLNDDQLRQLYDICDILIVPSRGGGFELNALEGISRGLPTLVPSAGCFLDYIDYCIPVPITGKPKVLVNNPIHTGVGWETNGDFLAHAIELTLSGLDDWKDKAQLWSKAVCEEYSWDRVCGNLFNLLVQYGFLQV